MNSKLLNTTATFILLTLLVFILHTGRSLIVPLVIALVIWYIIIQFSALLQKIKIKKHNLPYGIALLFSIIFAAIIVYLFMMALTYSITNIISEAPRYQAKIHFLIDWVNKLTHGKFDLSKLASSFNVGQIFSHMALIVSDMLSNATLILIYLLFLLLEYKTFNQKVISICKTKKQYEKASAIINRIHSDINKFLKVKTAVNALAGIVSYIVLLFFDIQYAEFWGMLIFLLHYIPFIGPIIAVIFVLLAVSIQLTSLTLFIVLAVLLALVQFVAGNLIEPKYMGNQLNLSPIVILLSLAFWGYVWGIIGMFLCVPLMVIIAIIFANFPQTKSIALALSVDGKVSS